MGTKKRPAKRETEESARRWMMRRRYCNLGKALTTAFMRRDYADYPKVAKVTRAVAAERFRLFAKEGECPYSSIRTTRYLTFNTVTEWFNAKSHLYTYRALKRTVLAKAAKDVNDPSVAEYERTHVHLRHQ